MKDVPKAIEAVWKIESTRLIAAIARITHDIDVAEELARDALVTALELWPEEGIPENPGAWLMTAIGNSLSLVESAIDSEKVYWYAQDENWAEEGNEEDFNPFSEVVRGNGRYRVSLYPYAEERQ
ncbi:MAG: hypothetical protein V7641_4640 [Blastocatellia bacterium]